MEACGNYQKPESKRCCYSSVNKFTSNYVASGYQYEGEWHLEDLPAGASHSAYCSLEALDTFDGYHNLLLLADGSCVDDRYSCSADGTLSLYEDTNCTEPMESYTPTSDPLDTSFGEVQLQMVTIEKATGKFIWTAYTPSNELAPNLLRLNTTDTISCIMFFAAFFATLFTLYADGRRYLQGRTYYSLFRLLVSFTLCFWVVCRFFYWITVFESIEAFAIYMQVVDTCYNLATLSVAMQSNIFINQFGRFKWPYWKWVNTGFLILANLGLSGGLYLDYLSLTSNPYQTVIKEWAIYKSYWELIMFSYDIFPSYLTAKLLLSSHKKKRNAKMAQLWYELYQEKPGIYYMIIIQLIVIIAHVIFSYIKDDTAILGNDKMYLGIGDSTTVFLTIMHTFLTCLFLEKVKQIVNLGTGEKSSIRNRLKNLIVKASVTSSKFVSNLSVGSVSRAGESRGAIDSQVPPASPVSGSKGYSPGVSDILE
ncbi:hypothetical protein EDD86DRAFT_210227 [Gorgonomyces haynaldii]|nr:hypothetical protein EDD86DRAFT_210227 [Gorgonomyces haynaldii]